MIPRPRDCAAQREDSEKVLRMHIIQPLQQTLAFWLRMSPGPKGISFTYRDLWEQSDTNDRQASNAKPEIEIMTLVFEEFIPYGWEMSKIALDNVDPTTPVEFTKYRYYVKASDDTVWENL